MKLLVMHLSDIHIKEAHDVILARVDAIAATAFSELPSSEHVAIVVSGDIAFSGTQFQYKIAERFLREIKDVLVAERAIPVTFIITPGNHDCDFLKDSGTRRHLLAQLLGSENPEIDDSVVAICTEPQAEYFHFRDSLEGGLATTGDALWRSRELKIGEKTIRFDSVNMAWLSQLPEEPGHLYFPAARYESMAGYQADLRLLVSHQPFNWLNQYSYRPIRKLLRSLASVVFTGHEHVSNSGTVDDQESGQSAFVEGGVLQSDSQRADDSSFNIVTL
jgi:calcineurin-like phosphoesterase family protein